MYALFDSVLDEFFHAGRCISSGTWVGKYKSIDIHHHTTWESHSPGADHYTILSTGISIKHLLSTEKCAPETPSAIAVIMPETKRKSVQIPIIKASRDSNAMSSIVSQQIPYHSASSGLRTASGSGSISTSDTARPRTRREMSMSVSSPIKVHSSLSVTSSSTSCSATVLAEGVGENGVDDTIDRCRARVLAYSRSR